MLAHFLRMALKALLRFKLHSAINFLSLGFGFICFVTAVLLANYMDSYDQQWPNANRIYNVVIRNVGEGTGPDKFPIVNDPAARYLRSYFPDIPNIVKASMGISTTSLLTVSLTPSLLAMWKNASSIFSRWNFSLVWKLVKHYRQILGSLLNKQPCVSTIDWTS